MARTKEQLSWDNFSEHIDPRKILAQQTELLYSGESWPDVLCINWLGTVFLIENKALHSWPKRGSTFPLRDAFEPGQINTMRKWKFKKGNAFVLLRVENEFYLMDPSYNLDALNREDLLRLAVCIGRAKIILHLSDLQQRIT